MHKKATSVGGLGVGLLGGSGGNHSQIPQELRLGCQGLGGDGFTDGREVIVVVQRGSAFAASGFKAQGAQVFGRHHGLARGCGERLPGGGAIDIRLACEHGWIRIEVGNDVPADGSRAAEGHRIGLNSARERVRALSEGRGDVETTSVDGRHVAVLRIPDEPAP